MESRTHMEQDDSVDTEVVALSTDELNRRIVAARLLRGVSQEDLAARFEADGLGRYDVGRIERGEKPLDVVRLEALCRHLRVPAYWFTSSDVDELVGIKPRAGLEPDEVTRAADALARLLAAVQAQQAGPGQGPPGDVGPGPRREPGAGGP